MVCVPSYLTWFAWLIRLAFLRVPVRRARLLPRVTPYLPRSSPVPLRRSFCVCAHLPALLFPGFCSFIGAFRYNYVFCVTRSLRSQFAVSVLPRYRPVVACAFVFCFHVYPVGYMERSTLLRFDSFRFACGFWFLRFVLRFMDWLRLGLHVARFGRVGVYCSIPCYCVIVQIIPLFEPPIVLYRSPLHFPLITGFAFSGFARTRRAAPLCACGCTTIPVTV